MTLKVSDKKEKCKLCELKYNRSSSGLFVHTPVECLEERLKQEMGKTERLTISLASWKEAWFNQRDIIGRISWEIPPVHYLSDERKREFIDKAEELTARQDYPMIDVSRADWLADPKKYNNHSIRVMNEDGTVAMTIRKGKI